MSQFYIILLISIGLAALVAWLYLRRKRNRPIAARVFAITNKTTGISGLEVWLEDGANISVDDLPAIETGLERTFEKARCRGYTLALSLSDYIVAIVKGEPDSDGNPCYRIPAGVYAGTVYDKGGYILVAGQMLTAGEPYGNIIVIPEHNGQRLDHLALVAEFEAEHVVLAYNDGDEFERTKVHGNGTGHPIIPNCSGELRSGGSQILCGDIGHLSPVGRLIAADETDPRYRQPVSFLSK